MKWTKLKKTPSHKDLVLIKNDKEEVLPAIYYNNQSFKGFYRFTTFYANYNPTYNKVYLNEKDELKDVVAWMLFPE